jgi:hypothetical protein
VKAFQVIEPLSDFFGILVRPEREFESLSARPRWFASFLYLCAGKAIIEYFHSLIELRVITSDVFSALDPDKLEKSAQFIKAVSYFTIALTPAVIIIKNLVAAALLYWLITLVSEEVQFRKIFIVSIHCWLIVLVARFFNLLILILRGSENLVYLEDLDVNLGLDIMLGESQNPVLRALFENINVFSLWHLSLLIVGISIVAGISKRRAAMAAMFVWVLTVALKVGQSIWNQNVGKIMG